MARDDNCWHLQCYHTYINFKKEEKKQTLEKNETQPWISNTKQLLSYNIRDFYEVQTSKLLMGVYVLRLLRYWAFSSCSLVSNTANIQISTRTSCRRFTLFWREPFCACCRVFHLAVTRYKASHERFYAFFLYPYNDKLFKSNVCFVASVIGRVVQKQQGWYGRLHGRKRLYYTRE